MKKLIAELRREHEEILESINRLEALASFPVAGSDERELRELLNFIHAFVDELHHAKEETMLFTLMQRDPGLARIAAVLEQDHAEGRRMVRAIESALDANPEAVCDEVLSYTSHIREHIRKENDMVFEMLEQLAEVM